MTGLRDPLNLAAGNRLTGWVESNFLINEVQATLYRADGQVAAQMTDFPENKRCSLAAVPFDREVQALSAGTYRFVLTVKIGYGDCVCADRIFTK